MAGARRADVIRPRVHSAGFSSPVRPWTYLLNQTVMIVHYLRLAIWPRALVLNYGAPSALTLQDVAPYAVLVVALFLVTVAALALRPKLGFLGAWFFVTLAPASSIVPIATEVGAERRMYLPLAGLIALAVVGCALVWERIERTVSTAPGVNPGRLTPAAGRVVLALVVAALAVATIGRNREYSSGLSIARTVLERRPRSIAHHMLGTELILAGKQEEAVPHLREATAGEPRAYYSLGVELFNEGKLDESIEQLQQFVTREPLLFEVVSARTTLGRAFAAQEKWPQAVEQYRLVLRMAPSNIEGRGLLGDACSRPEVVRRSDRPLSGVPATSAERRRRMTNLGVALATGKAVDAVSAFRRAVELQPRSADAHRNLANALLDGEAFDEAAAQAEQAVRLTPDDAVAHELLGLALAVKGKLDAARAELERSLEIDPADATTREELGRSNGPGRATPAGRGRP